MEALNLKKNLFDKGFTFIFIIKAFVTIFFQGKMFLGEDMRAITLAAPEVIQQFLPYTG